MRALSLLRKVFNIVSDIGIAWILTGIVSVYLLQFFGIRSYIVESGSMEPVILTGSLCLIEQDYAYEDVVVGDIIAYETTNKMVTHRVIEKTSDGFRTKGDNNDISDGTLITEENFVGKNILAIPLLGYAIAWLQTKRGKILMVTFILAMFILNIILTEFNEKISEKKLLP